MTRSINLSALRRIVLAFLAELLRPRYLVSGLRILVAVASVTLLQAGVVPDPLKPKFSAQPGDQEILAVRIFPHPLVPIEGSVVKNENRDLSHAIKGFADREAWGDVTALKGFLKKHPNSRWAPAVYLNIGIFLYESGAFSGALDAFTKAWDLSKSTTEHPGTLIRDRSAAEASKMHARLGNQDWLEKFAHESEGIPFEGSAAELINHSREALSMMQNEPEKCFMCGPYALLNVLPATVPPDVLEAIRKPQSTPQGTSLAHVLELSKAAGGGFQVAYREPGSEIVVPAVVHWKLGHFAAVVSTTPEGIISRDPTFGDEIKISPVIFDQEASGYFLIPKGKLPKGWRRVDSEEAATVWGKGLTTGKDPNETLPSSVTTMPKSCSFGMATYNFHAMLVGLTISDTPLSYRPYYGPVINFTVTYNQRDVAQNDLKNYSNLGRKWSHNWLSYVEPTSSTTKLVERGGGSIVFKNFTPPPAPTPSPSPTPSGPVGIRSSGHILLVMTSI